MSERGDKEMKAERFAIDKSSKQQIQGPFLRISEKGCVCGCSPPYFVSVSDGEQGITLVLNGDEWQRLADAFAQDCVHLSLETTPEEAHNG